MCLLSDTKLDARRQNLEGRGMRFSPERPQGLQERPMVGLLPKVAWISWAPEGVLGCEGSAIHLHPITPTSPSTTARLPGDIWAEGKGELTWAHTGHGNFHEFLDMLVVVVTVICPCGPLHLLDILERWAKRWSSYPPDEDDLNKAGSVTSSPTQQSTVSSTPGGQPLPVFPRPQDLDLQLDASSLPGNKIWK